MPELKVVGEEMKKEDIKVGIVVVCYNNLAYTKICVESVLKNTTVPYGLFVVDNASQDSTVEYLKEVCERAMKKNPYCKEFRIIENKENLGFGGGNNSALRMLQNNIDYSHVLLLNNDTIVGYKYLERMLKLFKVNSKIGMVGPKSNWVGGSQWVSNCPAKPENAESYSDMFYKQHKDSYVESGRLIAFCLLMKREVLDKVGLFDERYVKGNWEDNDYALRARLEGFRSAIANDVFIYHFGSKTLGKDAKELFENNKIVFYNKWGEINKIGQHKKVVGMLRVKNGGEMLRKTLTEVSKMVDEIVVFNDHSTDNTEDICRNFIKVVEIYNSQFDVFNEARDRNYLLNMAKKRNPDWIYCLSGDTQIPLIDGTMKTIKELSEKVSWEDDYVYSVAEDKNILPGKINKVWKTGTKEVIKITLDNNESFKCTKDHLIMMRDGTYTKAGELKEEDSLMPLYRKYNQPGLPGYELFYNPGENAWHFSHRSFWKYFNREDALKGRGYLIHHKDFNPLNNGKGNLEQMSNLDHSIIHSRNRTEAHNLHLRLANQSFEKRSILREMTKARFADMSQEERAIHMRPAQEAARLPEARYAKSISVKEYWDSLTSDQRKQRNQTTWDRQSQERKFELARSRVLMHLRTGRNVSPEILQKYNVLLNHKVVKVDSCGIEDVYDMEIVKYHNFAIGFSDKSGVFVHNCIDHDEIPEQRLIRDIQKIINDPNPEIKLIVFKICHLWNDEYHYRTDGLWGGFLQGRLFKNECDQEIEDKENTGFHCGSHPHIPSENMKIVPYRIKHYGNINAAIRMKKYLFYTTNDKVKDVNAILGGWKVWYANLYKCLDEIAAKKGKDFRLEKYELKDSDYYRHIVNEATLKRVEFKEGIILSLPMIVKDEEASIRKALESVKDFVDEIIIVDTGSKDKTLEIAKEYTDKIYHHDWKDNFSEARNYALSLCQGDYILRLDADEILPDGREILWHAIFNQEADLIMFSIHNYMLDPKTNNNAPYTLSKTVRMFRNISGIKYGGRIHEEIDESVNELSKTSHITMSNSRIPILHYGYLRGKEDLKKKHEYYAELAKLDMKDDPKNFKPYFNLATHYYHTENFEEAEKMYRKSLELNPKQWMAWHDLGVLIYKNALRKIDSELGEAKSYFDKSKENMPELVDEQYVQRMNVNLKHVEGLIDGISSKCNNLESIK